MVNRIILFVFIGFLVSCGFSKRLPAISSKINSPVFVFENAKVKISISKEELLEDAINLLQASKNIEDYPENGLKHLSMLREKEFDEYHLPLNLENNPNLENEKLNSYLYLFPTLYKKLKKGQLSLFSKENGEYENFYYYKQIRDKLGTQTDVFEFKNGVEFFSRVVALGE